MQIVRYPGARFGYRVRAFEDTMMEYDDSWSYVKWNLVAFHGMNMSNAA